MTLHTAFQKLGSALTGSFRNTSSDEITLTRRHIAILSLIHEMDGELEGKQRLQKLIFLTDSESEIDPLYEYRKYDYGPYSKQLTTDSAWLARNGVIHIRKDRTFGGNVRRTYTLTETGEGLLETASEMHPGVVDDVLNTIRETVTSHGDTSITRLIDQVRDEHPEYWENSVYRTRL